MSGLALVLHLDGRAAKPADLEPMLSELMRRGPDGEGIACDGPVALGHRLLASTPEAAGEKMPFLHPQTGCQITGHIRLDNRDTLLTQFDLQNAGRVIGDGELTLLAWLTWGEDCATHLLGDFAFAIWDPRQKRIFAARDQMGMRQLIYAHRPYQVFACASSARAVVRAPCVKPQLNETRLAEAMIRFEHGSFESTMYQDVFRLPPAHCLTVDDRGLQIRQYWQAVPPEPQHLKSDEAYAEAFREVLAEAVRCRLRGADGQVGSMLSGGMDSGSIVALGCRMTTSPLPTFSSVGPTSDTCVETRAIHAALTMPNLLPTTIDYSQLEPWKDDLIAAWLALEEPFDFHMTQPRTTYLAAQRAGVKVVLDGVAGDVVLGHGGQMSRYIRSGQLMRAWRDATGLAKFWGPGSESGPRQLIQATRSAFVPDWLRVMRQSWRKRQRPNISEDAIIDPDFALSSGLFDSLQAWRLLDRPRRMSFPEERLWAWQLSGITVGRERYDRVAAHFGIEPRDPFMDRRVHTFCLSLPMDQLQKDGWPKVILRRAMAGLLPDEVRWRRGKEHLGYTFTESLFSQWPDWKLVVMAGINNSDGRISDRTLDAAKIPMKTTASHSMLGDTLLETCLLLRQGHNSS
ncbi:asparagine synthase-related protein [Tateyamaria pelophila]|uniref:asparagine synthase-related protein n=1 Tax=Tateyamaria pelophila TaxID=328415 RepID=UPI001CC0B61F|nr:asparagine synthase-related protein [Tateyamaria pelophila]